MKRYIILTATAAFLTSCGIYTKYQPVSSVPEDLYGQETTLQSDTASLASLSWRALFTDPYLQSLIETGLENNTDYRVAELQIQEAEASLLAAKLSFLPSFLCYFSAGEHEQLRRGEGFLDLLSPHHRQLGARHLRPYA